MPKLYVYMSMSATDLSCNGARGARAGRKAGSKHEKRALRAYWLTQLTQKIYAPHAVLAGETLESFGMTFVSVFNFWGFRVL